MIPDPENIHQIIQSACEALQRGDYVTVTRLARLAADLEPESEIPWLLLATVASPEDSLSFIKKALEINPASEAARDAIEWAQARLPKPPAPEPPIIREESPSSELEPARTEVETELQDADIPPLSEQDQWIEAYPASPPVEIDEPGTEPLQPRPAFELQDVEPVQPGDWIALESAEPAPLTDELEPAQLPPEPQPEPIPLPVDEPGLQTESPGHFTSGAALPVEQVHPAIKPSSLKNSHKPAGRRAKRSTFSNIMIFLTSVLAGLALAALLGLLFLRPQLTSFWQSFIVGEGCQASLEIGALTYRVWPIKPDPDGNYAIPANQPERAYYVEGTASNYVFFLSPHADNQALMSGLPAGEDALVTWSNCNTSAYRLGKPRAQILDMPTLLEQSRTGITILTPWQGSSSGFVLLGGLQ